MSESDTPEARAAKRVGLNWFQSFLRRVAVHLPWLFGLAVYVTFFASGQGATALEVPVERPLLSLVVVGALLGLYGAVMFHFRQSFADPGLHVGEHPYEHYTTRALSPAHVTIGRVAEKYGLHPERGLRLQKCFRRFTFLGAFFVFGAAISGTATVAQLSLDGACAHWCIGPLAIGSAAVPIFIIGVAMDVARRSGLASRSRRAFTQALPLMLALLLFAIGVYMVTQHLDVLVGLGSHALVASGVIMIALLVTGIICLLWHQLTLRVAWAVLAALVLISLLQSPLPERPNPLLVQTPTVVRAATTCSRLTIAPADRTTTEALPSSDRATGGPSILVSAEGGGIRAAYWTAVSLEELSQAVQAPLLDATDIISGVSGGSLGIATFLAAQELPRAARLPCIREFLSGDFLSPLVAGLLFLDLPRLVLPSWLLDKHRGDYFEAYFAKRWLTLTGSDYFYRPLASAGGARSQRASVYFNATDALSGQYIGLPAHPPAGVRTAFEPPLSPLNRAVLRQLPELRVAQAVHFSARFPYLSPSPDLRAPASDVSRALFDEAAAAEGITGKVSLGSLVDGGYFDNSGLWPAFRLLEADRRTPPAPKRFVLHIVNDQARACRDASKKPDDPASRGCLEAAAEVLKARRGTRAGWLLRPAQAIGAVRTEHSLQSIVAMEIAVPRPDERRLWIAPMHWNEPPGLAGLLLDAIMYLPIHGRDQRDGRVALAWTLAPLEREFLCKEAAKIRSAGVAGRQNAEPVDRTKDCAPKRSD